MADDSVRYEDRTSDGDALIWLEGGLGALVPKLHHSTSDACLVRMTEAPPSVAINREPAAVPDPERLRGCLEAGFAEVLGVA